MITFIVWAICAVLVFFCLQVMEKWLKFEIGGNELRWRHKLLIIGALLGIAQVVFFGMQVVAALFLFLV